MFLAQPATSPQVAVAALVTMLALVVLADWRRRALIIQQGQSAVNSLKGGAYQRWQRLHKNDRYTIQYAIAGTLTLYFSVCMEICQFTI